MIQELPIVLAINPGTKYIGLAVLDGQDLVYWGIKVLKGKWSKDKMKTAQRAVKNIIDQYHVKILILKRLHLSRSSRNLNLLVSSIKKMANRKGIKLCLYSLEDIKKYLAIGKRSNKMVIAEIMAKKYPFLIHELEKEKKHKHPYFVRMFEAIAAGVLILGH